MINDFPDGHRRFDNRRSREVLGLEYMGSDKCVVDAVEFILARGVHFARVGMEGSIPEEAR